MAQPIPGVWDYLYKNPHDYGASFSAGVQAGAKARSVKDDREARAEELARRTLDSDREFGLQQQELERRKGEDAQRRKEHQDRLDREAQQRNDALNERFGPAIVRHPNGEIDVAGSAEEAASRKELDRKAEALGEQEIMLRKPAGPEFDTLRQFPGYVIGQSRALQRLKEQEAIDQRAKAAADSRIETARIRSGGDSSKPDAVEEVNGVPMIRTGDGKLKPLSTDARRQYERSKRPTVNTNAPPNVRAVVTFDAQGNPIIKPSK